MYGTAVSEARGEAFVPEYCTPFVLSLRECRSLSANEVSTRRVAAVSKIFKIPRPLHQLCPFSEALSLYLQLRKKIRRLQQRAVVTGTNGRAGSGETRAREHGDWCLVQGWLRRATTPPMCPVRIGCRCVEQMGQRRQIRRVPCEWPEARSSNRTAEVS